MKRSVALGHHSLATIAAMSMAGIAIARQEDPQGPHLLSLKTFDDDAPKFNDERFAINNSQHAGKKPGGITKMSDANEGGPTAGQYIASTKAGLTKMAERDEDPLYLNTGAKSPAWLQDAESFAKKTPVASAIAQGLGRTTAQSFAHAA